MKIESKPLIVCLNKTLANHIKKETLPQHLNSEIFQRLGFGDEEN